MPEQQDQVQENEEQAPADEARDLDPTAPEATEPAAGTDDDDDEAKLVDPASTVPGDTEAATAGPGVTPGPHDGPDIESPTEPDRAMPAGGYVRSGRGAVLARSLQADREDLRAGAELSRTMQVSVDAVDLEARTVRVSFSSIAPVSRYWGDEVLSHDPGAIRLDRLQDGAAVLVNHNTDKHVAAVIPGSVEIDTRAGVGRAVVLFSRRQEALDVLQDIADGVRRFTSVGYTIHAATEQQRQGQPPLITVTDWEPYEITFASIPADASVGVGRAKEDPAPVSVPPVSYDDVRTDHGANQQEERDMPPENTTEPTTTVDPQDVLATERQRTKAIMALGEMHNARDLAQRAVNEGTELETFQSQLLDTLSKRDGSPVRQGDVRELEDNHPTDLGLPDKELRAYSLFRAVRAMEANNWEGAELERECHLALAKKLGEPERGTFRVPHDALAFDIRSDGHAMDALRMDRHPAAALLYAQLTGQRDITTASGGAALVGTELQAGSYIDMLRNRSVVLSLGARVLDGLVGNITIPRRSTGATFYWLDEGDTTTESSPAFLGLSLSPKTLSGRVDLTRRMLLQSSPAVELLTKDDMALGEAVELDRVLLNGLAANDEPVGVNNTSGVGAVVGGTNGATLTWAHIVALETKVAQANADMGSLAYVINPGTRGFCKTTPKVAGYPVFLMGEQGNTLNGYTCKVTNNQPNNLDKGDSDGVCQALTFGNWRDVIVGFWSGLEIKVDEVTLGDSGGLVLRCFRDADAGLRHAGSMAVMEDALLS